MVNMLNRVDQEVERVIGDAWLELKKQNSTFVARHSIMVVACVVRDPMFANLPPNLQNCLKWASLLHDIAKLSKPVIEGRDHVHPFKSAIVVLDVFERLGFIENLTEQKKGNLLQVKRLLAESI